MPETATDLRRAEMMRRRQRDRAPRAGRVMGPAAERPLNRRRIACPGCDRTRGVTMSWAQLYASTFRCTRCATEFIVDPGDAGCELSRAAPRRAEGGGVVAR
jgi:hypothetical protein